MKADMADKEMLESSQSKYEEEVREKCSIISEQKAVRSDQLGNGSVSGHFLKLFILTQISHLEYFYCRAQIGAFILSHLHPGCEKLTKCLISTLFIVLTFC